MRVRSHGLVAAIFFSLPSTCLAHILLNPAIILDATSQLSAFLLSAEVQNVKDIADSLFSQENIDVVSAVAADTLKLAKDTIDAAQSSIDVKNIADAITNSVPATRVGSAVEGFLNSNPDLKLPTSE
jgi:hypothetical protein